MRLAGSAHIFGNSHIGQQGHDSAVVLCVLQRLKQLVAGCKAVGDFSLFHLCRCESTAMAAGVGRLVKIVRREYCNPNGRFISRFI